MLAQAQEIFYIKSVDKNLGSSTVSKIVNKTSDYYADAMKATQKKSVKDLKTIKPWLPVLAGKQALFRALSEYHRSEHEMDQHEMGVALARLSKALDNIRIADERGGKQINMKAYMTKIQLSYDKAKKYNELVYHERVPDYKSLPVLQGASFAKATILEYPISENFRGMY